MTTEAADPVEAVASFSGRRSRLPPALRRDHRIHPDPRRGAGRRARGVRHFRRAVRQEPARPLFLHVPGRVRHLVFLAEHADPRRAADPHRALHGAARATRHGDHRRRRRAPDRRAVGDLRRRWRMPVGAAAGGADWRWSVAGIIGGGLWITLSGALRQYRGVNETISSLLLVYIGLRSSTIWSRARCATRPASTSRRRAKSAPPT